MAAYNMSNNVSVYVLRERLHETFEKRESLKKEEETIFREVVQGLPYGERMLKGGTTFYDQALTGIVEGTAGHDNLLRWREKFIEKQHSIQ